MKLLCQYKTKEENGKLVLQRLDYSWNDKLPISDVIITLPFHTTEIWETEKSQRCRSPHKNNIFISPFVGSPFTVTVHSYPCHLKWNQLIRKTKSVITKPFPFPPTTALRSRMEKNSAFQWSNVVFPPFVILKMSGFQKSLCSYK